MKHTPIYIRFLLQFLVCTLHVVVVCSTVSAQPQTQPFPPDRSILPILGDRINTVVYSLPAADTSMMQIAVFYSFGHDAVTFVASTKSAILKNYYAPLVITLEIRDSTGIIRHAKEIADTIGCDTYEESISATTTSSGSYTLTLKRGDYIASIDIQQQNATIRKYKTAIPALHATQGVFATQCILASGTSGDDLITPVIAANAVPFNGSNVRVVIPTFRTSQSDAISYVIRQRQSKQTESQPAADLTKGVFRLKSLGQLIARTSGVSAIPPVIASTRTASDNLYIDAQIPSSVLSPGAYVLVLTNQTTRDSAVLPFNIVWNDMPQSYRSMRVALDYMQYILSESEYDALRDGTDREARLNVETWWKKSDPTPQTAYNEKMVEFFRRCDYAKTTFSNFGTMDGVKTERGKIHVLFGFPTTITNAEDGKARTEVWRYENKVKQQFTFEISTNGVFKLAKVENI